MNNKIRGKHKACQLIATMLLPGILTCQSHAQTATDIENAVTTGSILDDAIKLPQNGRTRVKETGLLPGEAGIFILKKNKIFYVSSAIASGFTSNPGRTLDTNSKDAAYGSLALSAGVNTRIAGKYDAGASLVVSGTEYDRSDAPSNRNFIGNAYIGRSVFDGLVYLSGNATAGVSTDRSFKRDVAFYAIGINASMLKKLSKNILFRPSISARRQWSGQSEQNNFDLSAIASVIWFPKNKWVVTGTLSYSYKNFDNFFEDVTFVKRRDNVFRGFLSVAYKLNKDIYLSLSLDYTDQNSSFFLSEYTALDSGVSLKISKRF